MYEPVELARFALSEFERGLDRLTDEEARTRLVKADGSQMNAISWTVGHIAWQWCTLAARVTLEQPPASTRPFRFGSDDPTPPALADALRLLHDAKAANDWIASADDVRLSTVREEWVQRGIASPVTANESVGTYMMRVVLHTWFHTGEINAMRQMLGHAEIRFVSPLTGNLEWHSEQHGEVTHGSSR